MEKKTHAWRLWLIYGLFVTVCVVASVLFLSMIHRTVLEYDTAQPENTVERILQEIQEEAELGRVPEYVLLNPIGSEKFETAEKRSVKEQFLSKIQSSDALQFRSLPAGGNDRLSKEYSVYAGKEWVATLKLTGENERTKLFFFSMADWSIDSVEPVISAVYYHVNLMVPAGLRVFLNGIPVDENDPHEMLGEIPMYSIGQLLSVPRILYLNAEDQEIPYTISNETVTPLVYHFDLSLPEEVKVTRNGEEMTGDKDSDGFAVYHFQEMTEPLIVLTDLSGYSVTYHPGDEVSVYRYDVTLPENFRLSVGSLFPEPDPASLTRHPDHDYLSPFVGDLLPGTVSYSFGLLNPLASLKVVNNLGVASYYRPENRVLIITDQAVSPSLKPVSGIPDPLKMAHTWSLLMTGDLSGSYHGFYEMAAYLVKDSDYYRYAWKWVNGVDFTLTSIHTFDGFVYDRVYDYVRYGDNCFSCHISFTKQMTLYAVGSHKKMYQITDSFDNIVYFVYVDDTPDNGRDDPHWAIAYMKQV